MKNTLAKNAFFNVLYRILNVIFPLITATYISRVLGPAGIGKVNFAQNIVSYFLMFAALGIPAYGTREIAKRQGERDAVNRLFTELLLINSAATTVCLVVYFFVVQAVFSANLLIYLIFGLDLLFNYINIDWYYQGQEKYGYITLRSLLVKLFSLILLFWLVKDSQDYVVYALIVCFGTGCNYFFNIVHAGKYVKLTFRGLNLRQHMRPILTLLISSVTASLYNKVDITMLGWISTNEAVGFYTNAHKIVGVVLTMVTAISAVFLPRLSYVFVNQRASYEKILSTGLKIVLMLALPCCVGLFLVSDKLIPVFFGELFIPAVTTLRILTILVVIRGAGDLLCYQAIISTGKEKHLIKSRILASAANILLNSILIPHYAQNGAATASVISELIVNGVMLYYSLSIAKPRVECRFLISIITGTALMAAAVILIRSVVTGMLQSLLLSVTVGAVIYFGTALLLKNDLLTSAVSALVKYIRKT